MISKIWDVLIAIKNRDRIPPVPRMYATEYQHLTIQERRVLARMGARDPRGIKVAMRRYGVDTVDELIERLGHHRPKRRIWHRIRLAFARMAGGDSHPHLMEARKLIRQSRRGDVAEIRERVKRAARGD